MAMVFISYAREDVEAARRLRSDLKAAGLQIWFDEDNLLPGQIWKNEITDAIRKSRYFLAVLSSNSVGKRGFVQKELKRAIDMLEEYPENEVYIIPVRIDDCDPTYEKLKQLHRVDLFPVWKIGVQKILLTMEIEAGGIESSSITRPVHPKNKPFHMSAVWNDDGLQITGGNIVIPAKDAMRLFRVWADWVPDFVEREASKHGIDAAYERAFITGAIRAFHDVFNVVPSEAEMQRGSSILSRKMNLFFAFARELSLKARKRGIDLKEYLFQERNTENDGVPDTADRRNLYRTLLHAYVSRVCDVNLDEVEKVENAMRQAFGGHLSPPWEELVEGVYDIDENTVLTAYQAVKEKLPEETDEKIVDSITAHFIMSAVLEEFPFADAGDEK